MKVKTASWKKKVDPAFDKFIKLYLVFLEVCNLPSNEGYISPVPPPDYLRRLETEGFPSIASMYECDTPEDASFDFISMIDETFTMRDFKGLIREIKKNEDNLYMAHLYTASQFKDNDSKEYYLKKFEPLISDNGDKIHFENMDEKRLKKWRKEFYSDMLSLQCHTIVNAIEGIKENLNERRKQIVKRFNEQPKILRRSIFFVWNTICLLVHKKSMKHLFVEARKGEDASLFKLMQIDKTLFDHDWVRARIRKASFLGDWNFFANLSKAIKTDPLENRKVHGDIFLILIFFWPVGLYRLTIPEIMQLFKDSGVRMIYDEINLRKFIDREIKTLFKEWQAL